MKRSRAFSVNANSQQCAVNHLNLNKFTTSRGKHTHQTTRGVDVVVGLRSEMYKKRTFSFRRGYRKTRCHRRELICHMKSAADYVLISMLIIEQFARIRLDVISRRHVHNYYNTRNLIVRGEEKNDNNNANPSPLPKGLNAF